MPRLTRGSVFPAADGTVGIRWPENGHRPQKIGFVTKTEARRWFDENVAPRLRHSAPSPDMTFDAFCDLYLARHGASKPTIKTLTDWLVAPRARFGDWSLRDLEGAADDIAAWAATLTPHRKYIAMRAMRQVLHGAVRWRYVTRNAAVDAGPNPEPRSEELRPFTRNEVDMLAAELGPVYGPLVIVAAETGLRTNEWAASERRDIDRTGRHPAIIVQRRVRDGVVIPYPKTTRRRIPLSDRAITAIEHLPPRIDTPLLFCAPKGGHINLDTWRTRDFYPALDAAGIERRGPYHLRHTFATEALANGMSIFQLARIMGASVKTIDRHYGHLAHDSEDAIHALLNTSPRRSGVVVASDAE